MYAGDAQIGEGRVERTIPLQFSFDEMTDVGADLASPVPSDYGATGNEFTGTLSWVRIDLGDDDHSHLIDPEHRLAVAMMKQYQRGSPGGDLVAGQPGCSVRQPTHLDERQPEGLEPVEQPVEMRTVEDRAEEHRPRHLDGG